MNANPPAPPRLGPMLLLACCAFVTTGAYAASFYVPAARRLAPAALEVSVGAACAWPVFGLVLLALTGARPSVLQWADACLRTMAVGNTVLLLGAALNLTL